MSCVHGRLRCVQVRLFLKLANVFLVPDSLVPEPVGYLEEGDKVLVSLGF